MILSITRAGALLHQRDPGRPGLAPGAPPGLAPPRKDRTVFLKADRALSYGTVVETLDLLNRMGIENLGMVTDTSGSTARVRAPLQPSAADRAELIGRGRHDPGGARAGAHSLGRRRRPWRWSSTRNRGRPDRLGHPAARAPHQPARRRLCACCRPAPCAAARRGGPPRAPPSRRRSSSPRRRSRPPLGEGRPPAGPRGQEEAGAFRRRARDGPGAEPRAPDVSLPGAEQTEGAGGGGAVGAGGNVGVGGARFDQPDFKYSYYIERMLVSIGTNWFKPNQTAGAIPDRLFPDRAGRHDHRPVDREVQRPAFRGPRRAARGHGVFAPAAAARRSIAAPTSGSSSCSSNPPSERSASHARFPSPARRRGLSRGRRLPPRPDAADADAASPGARARHQQTDRPEARSGRSGAGHARDLCDAVTGGRALHGDPAVRRRVLGGLRRGRARQLPDRRPRADLHGDRRPLARHRSRDAGGHPGHDLGRPRRRRGARLGPRSHARWSWAAGTRGASRTSNAWPTPWPTTSSSTSRASPASSSRRSSSYRTARGTRRSSGWTSTAGVPAA